MRARSRFRRTIWMAVLTSACAACAHAGGPALPERLEALRAAYPGAIAAIDGNTLRLVGGGAIAIDDGRPKTHAAALVDADVEDMLLQIYPIGACDTGAPPARNFDPGRIRNEPLFRAIYGSSAAEVKRSLVSLPWFDGAVSVTANAGVDAALRKVAADLEALPHKYRPVVETTAGTFNWRVIAGTQRLSVHSFAAAIDVNTKYADYWLWSGGKPGDVPKYKNRVPKAVVEVFERHGFIWGGKWYHYDTMHFEYRPELIAIGRAYEKAGCQ